MIPTTSDWDARNAQLGKKPIYVMRVVDPSDESKVAVTYTTHDLRAEAITGPLPVPYKPWLKTPSGASQSVDVINGSSSIGELQCEVVVQDSSIANLVATANPQLEGQNLELSVGYPGLDYSKFVRLFTYQLYKVIPQKGYTSWLFQSRDPQIAAKRTIYVNPLNGDPLGDCNPWIVQGTPAEITQGVYLFALNCLESTIDRDKMVALDSAAEGLFNTVRPFLFILDRPYAAKQFLETEVYKPCGLYPVIDNFGKLSLRAFRPPAAGPAASYSFTEENICVLPDYERQEVLNSVVFEIDYDGSSYNGVLVFADATSISLYGRGQQLHIQSQGLKSVLGAQWWCQEMAARMFKRFAGVVTGLRGGAAKITVEAFYLTVPVWVGDYVNVTHHLMPDVATGKLGVKNRLYEVIDRQPDFQRGRMKFVLLDTGLTGLKGAKKIGAPTPAAMDFLIEDSASLVY